MFLKRKCEEGRLEAEKGFVWVRAVPSPEIRSWELAVVSNIKISFRGL